MVTPSEITVIGPLRTRHVAWDDIVSVKLTRAQTGILPWMVPALEMIDGEVVRADLPCLRSPSVADAFVGMVEQELRRRA